MKILRPVLVVILLLAAIFVLLYGAYVFQGIYNYIFKDEPIELFYPYFDKLKSDLKDEAPVPVIFGEGKG